jgi:hypothetical protein
MKIVIICLFTILTNCTNFSKDNKEVNIQIWDVYIPEFGRDFFFVDTIIDQKYLKIDDHLPVRRLLLDSLINEPVGTEFYFGNMIVYLDTTFKADFEGTQKLFAKIYFNHIKYDYVVTTIYNKDFGFLFINYHSRKGFYRLIKIKEVKGDKVVKNIDVSTLTKSLFFDKKLFPLPPPLPPVSDDLDIVDYEE